MSVLLQEHRVGTEIVYEIVLVIGNKESSLIERVQPCVRNVDPVLSIGE